MECKGNSTIRIGFFKHEVGGSGPAKVVKIIALFIIGIIGLAVLALLFGIFVKLLWNALMPAIFGLPAIGFWQAVGLVVLAHIFFGGDHSHHYERSSKRKKKDTGGESSLTAEMERDYREFWLEEGREAFGRWMKRGERLHPRGGVAEPVRRTGGRHSACPLARSSSLMP